MKAHWMRRHVEKTLLILSGTIVKSEKSKACFKQQSTALTLPFDRRTPRKKAIVYLMENLVNELWPPWEDLTFVPILPISLWGAGWLRNCVQVFFNIWMYSLQRQSYLIEERSSKFKINGLIKETSLISCHCWMYIDTNLVASCWNWQITQQPFVLVTGQCKDDSVPRPCSLSGTALSVPINQPDCWLPEER